LNPADSPKRPLEQVKPLRFKELVNLCDFTVDKDNKDRTESQMDLRPICG
jgi:hypothetical protein